MAEKRLYAGSLALNCRVDQGRGLPGIQPAEERQQSRRNAGRYNYKCKPPDCALLTYNIAPHPAAADAI